MQPRCPWYRFMRETAKSLVPWKEAYQISFQALKKRKIMEENEFLNELKEEFDLVKNLDGLLAFIKRTELALLKSQIYYEIRKEKK